MSYSGFVRREGRFCKIVAGDAPQGVRCGEFFSFFFRTPLALSRVFLVYYAPFSPHGDIAQLVERLNGIEKVRGSTPLISTPKIGTVR